MSTLYVDTINEKTSGNGIKIPGHVVQVVYSQDNSAGSFSTTSTSYVTDAVLPAATITPKYSNSLIYISSFIGMQYDNTGQIENTIYRSISGGATTDLSNGNTYGLVFSGVAAGSAQWDNSSVHWVDTPSTTSAVTYTWYARSENGVSVTPRHFGTSAGMVLMEIAQ